MDSEENNIETNASTTASESVPSHQKQQIDEVVQYPPLGHSISQSPVGPMTKKAFEESEITTGPMWIQAVNQANISRNIKRAIQKQAKSDASKSLLAKSRQQAAGGGVISGSASADGLSIVTDRSRRSRGQYPPSAVGNLHPIDEFSHVLEPPYSSDLQVSYFGDDILDLAIIRTRVVPLMMGGAVAIVGGFFASIYVQFSCDFVTALVDMEALGGGSKDYSFHFGIWKYTPISSVYKGYTYCDRYDEDYTAPAIPRMFGIFALLLGTYGLVVLWIYLIKGKTSELAWRTAIYALYLAAFSSLLMFLTLIMKLCHSNSCSMGPSSFVSLFTTLVWLLLAYVMKNHAPASVRITAAIRAQSEKVQPANYDIIEHNQQESFLKSLRKNKTHQVNNDSFAPQRIRYQPPDLI
jgi:hypothetical protein